MPGGRKNANENVAFSGTEAYGTVLFGQQGVWYAVGHRVDDMFGGQEVGWQAFFGFDEAIDTVSEFLET